MSADEYRAALEVLGVAICGEPWRLIWAEDEAAALRCIVVRIAADRLMAKASTFAGAAEKLSAAVAP